MGNCQAVDTASLIIQHPDHTESEKLFWPIPTSQIMKTNPGHCVALLITTTTTTTVLDDGADHSDRKNTVRITRVKLLKPTDTLNLGHVYRLISTQEVMKGLVAKKQAKMMKMKLTIDTPENLIEKGAETKQCVAGAGRRSSASSTTALASAPPEESNQMREQEKQRQKSTSSSSALLKSKAWQPSLKSISESHS